MQNKVSRNYIYNLIYQVVVLIVPLITAPYLSRILGSDGIGTYSYYYSIAYYFCMFIMLGINNYGNRSIAKCLNDPEKIDRKFTEIYELQFIIGLFVLCCYFLYAFFISKATLLCLCYIPFILSYLLDANWLFFGQENFKIILIRNVVIKFITTALIFTLVKSKEDVINYILIMSIGALISSMTIWVIILRQRKFVKVTFQDVFQHLKPNFILFLPSIAVSIYRIMDKIMLGSMSVMNEVGYYENAEKIISVLLSFITALGTVMLPRMSALYEQGDNEKIEKMQRNSILFVSLASSIVAFGIASVSDSLVYVYYGEDFIGSGAILMMLCFTVPCISYANIMRTQMLIPQGKDKEYCISCFAGAGVNLALNLILIPRYMGVGAAIATIGAEFVVLLVQYFLVKREFLIKRDIRSVLGFWINGLIMFIVVRVFDGMFPRGVLTLFADILIGAIIYVSLIVIQWRFFKDQVLENIFVSVKLKRKYKNREV